MAAAGVVAAGLAAAGPVVAAELAVGIAAQVVVERTPAVMVVEVV